MARVRARARGPSSDAPRPGRWPEGAAGRDPALDRDVQQARLLSDAPRVDVSLGWKTPVVGHAWLAIRRWVHQEIRIYIDALLQQQSAFNVSVARALGRIAERLDASASRAELEALRAEVEALRREVASLRGAPGEPDERDQRDGRAEQGKQDTQDGENA